MFYTVYLAGPITYLSYKDSTDWRKYVADKLPSKIEAVSPMRGKDFLNNGKQILIRTTYEDIPISSAKGVACRDRFDIKRCGVVLVNLLGAEDISIGSVLEIGWADAYRKPIILVIEKTGNPHEHTMLKELANFIVSDLDDAIDLVKKILLPGI